MTKKINIEDYNKYLELYDIIPYKNLFLQPITMKHYKEFEENIGIMSIDKNETGVIEFVKMSNLEFILTLCANDDSYLQQFMNIIKLTTYYLPEDILLKFDEDGKKYLVIDGTMFDKTDFDNIKKIICYQNIYDYSDEYIDPDLKKAINDTERIMAKRNKSSASINTGNQISIVQILTGLSNDEIYNMPIIKFIEIYEKAFGKSNYDLLKIAQSNGATIKGEIEHWAFKEKNSRINRVITTNQQVENMGIGSIE